MCYVHLYAQIGVDLNLGFTTDLQYNRSISKKLFLLTGSGVPNFIELSAVHFVVDIHRELLKQFIGERSELSFSGFRQFRQV